jgi:hypothetical protein
MTGYTLEVPEGFIPLPPSGTTAESEQALAELFGLEPGDISADMVTRSVSALGLVATAGGTEHSSIGLFRSPDDPQRPVSVVLTAGQIASDHDDPGAVMTGLREVCASDPNTNSHILQLPVGSALAAVREEPAMIEIEVQGRSHFLSVRYSRGSRTPPALQWP